MASKIDRVRESERKRKKEKKKKQVNEKPTQQLFSGARLNLNILISAAVEVHFILPTRQYAIKCTYFLDWHVNIVRANDFISFRLVSFDSLGVEHG